MRSFELCCAVAMTSTLLVSLAAAQEAPGVVRIQKNAGRLTATAPVTGPALQQTSLTEALSEAQEEYYERISGPPVPLRKVSGAQLNVSYSTNMMTNTGVMHPGEEVCPECHGLHGRFGHGAHCRSGSCRPYFGGGLGGYLHDKFGCLTPAGGGGPGVPLFGAYSRVYPNDPAYFDGRDGQLWAAQGYGAPVSVPLAPVVGHTYNYGWGVPSSRLTPVSRLEGY